MKNKPSASAKSVRPHPQPAARPAAADGTQAIRRAGSLLRTIAKSGAAGASLADAARATALARSTAHRMLRCLLDEGFLEADDSGKRYRMGPLIYELGLTSASTALEAARWRPVVDAVARRTGVTTYLMRRSGVESVCLVKADGNSVVRFVPVEVGQRRLLGVGAGATALLAAMSTTDAEHVIATIAPDLKPWPRITPEALQLAIRLARRTDFAISQGTVVEDGFGMGCAIPGTPHLAISIAAHASLATESNIKRWRVVMAEEIAGAAGKGGTAARAGA